MFASKLCLVAMTASLVFAATAAKADSLTTGNFYSGDQNNGSDGFITYDLNGTTTVGGGGNFTDTTGVVNGNTVNFIEVYCIDLNDTIGLNSTYTAAYTNDGTVNGSSITGAGQITWLLLNEGSSATTTAESEGLQAAIWSVEYPGSFTYLPASNDADVTVAFDADIAALGNNTASVSSVDWIGIQNPDGSSAQSLVGLESPVPEPSSIVFLGTGILGIAGAMRRRFQNA